MRINYFLLLAAITVASLTAQSQDKEPDWRKLHYLSEAEMHQELKHPQLFIETDPPTAPVRNVAEFDQMQAVLIRYPLGIPVELVKELADDIEVITLVAGSSEEQAATTIYTTNGVNLDNCSFLYAQTNSHWTRDYGPWFVIDGNNQPGIVDFPYNRPRPQDNEIPGQVANYLGIDLYGMNLIHTGGNYMTDGLGISSSTDLVPEENPTLSDEDIDSLVYYYLGIDDYYILSDPLDDYIKHIDCWGKFLSPGKVLIGEVPESDYRYDDFEAAANFFKNTISSWGKPYEVFRVLTPGGSPSTPFTNSLIANKRVYVPLTGSQWDDEALDAYEEAMPGYDVVGITYGSWFNTDALHCRAKGIADLGMLYIDHMPILGTVGAQDSYEITVDIVAISGEDIYEDSAFVYYSVNGGAYQSSNLTLESDDTWTGSISGVDPGDDVSYYVYAADESGRNATHPFIGEPDPHEFTVFGVQTDEIGFNPDTLMFLTFEDATDGLPLHVINMKSNPVEILDVTPESEWGQGFYWHAEGIPEMPYQLAGNDTMTLQVFVGIPLSYDGTMLYDKLTVSTDEDQYDAVIAVDSILVSSINDVGVDPELSVFPNPFHEVLNFSLNLASKQELTISIYDLTGKLVYTHRSVVDSGKHTVSWNVPDQLDAGHYIYRVNTEDQKLTGKIILHR